MSEPARVDPTELHEKIQGSGSTLLVCAYGSPAAFAKHTLQGAISFPDLQSRLPALPKDQEIVFY